MAKVENEKAAAEEKDKATGLRIGGFGEETGDERKERRADPTSDDETRSGTLMGRRPDENLSEDE